MLFTLANSAATGAFAQDAEAAPGNRSTAASSTDDTGPRFVANEVVQPLPESAAETADDAEADPRSLGELVAETPVDGALSRDMRCLAQAIYFEARGEPLEGQLAVGRVVINRTESSAFPDSYCEVVTQRAQFSFVKHGRIPTPRTSSAAWKRAVAVARIAHQELWDSAAGDSLYFHATYVNPRWARQKVARATLSRHIFYR